MEEKNNLTNNDFLTNNAKIKKNILIDKNNKKTDIKKYNSKQNTITKKKLEQNNITSFNNSKRKQKQIKQCFLDITNTKEKKGNKIQKEVNKPFKDKEKENEEIQNKSKEINKSELKINKYDNKTKNIKVNKIKIEKINLENVIKTNSNTNRDFYKRSADNNKNNLNLEQPNIINKYISDFYNSKKSKILSVKDFNKTNFDKNLLVKNDFLNSEYNNLNLISSFNKNNLLYENSYRYSNFSSNTYKVNNVIEINQVPYNSLKISFKNIKSFYAHLEIFISLYLKRTFKFFIEKIKKYEKPKINFHNINEIQIDGTNMNNYRPIVNVNNAHCSLYCSINLNQDKLFNSIFDNKNIYNFENNTYTPLTKSKDLKKIKQLNKDGINNNNKRNKILFVSPEYDTTLNNNKNMVSVFYKSVYIPKKKISKSNTNLISGVKTNNNNKNKNNFKNMKSSPIKEMNINLKQINVCRLNDLNQLYLSQNQNLYKNNSNNFNFSEITPLINISNNNLTNHVKYNSNNIFSKIINTYNSNDKNNNNEKPKLKKIQSTKNGIYMKPKDEKTKKIKEIKIQNKLTPLKKDIDVNKKENNMKYGNILNTYNSFNRNRNEYNTSKVYEKLYTINDDKEINPIKKIYIKRGSKQKNLYNINIKENLFDTYRNQFYSTFLNFKPNKNSNDEILIKQIATPDKKVFINIKYINYMKNNFRKNKNNILNYLNLKISYENSLSIINNHIEMDKNLNQETYEKLLLNRFNNNLKLQDIFSFDNEKKLNSNNKIQSKNISFTFKENTLLKEESQIIDENLYIFIFVLKNAIIKTIRHKFFNEYKKIKLFKKILDNEKNKIINFYFLKLKKNTISNNNKQIKIDKNNCGVYHKINYNDDFNCTKKAKNNPLCKSKAYNLSSHNSINQFNNKKKISNKKNLKIFSSDKSYKKTNKFVNKEINIFVHNNKNNVKNNDNDINSNNIALNKLKNKFFLMRIKLIKNALKVIKNAL